LSAKASVLALMSRLAADSAAIKKRMFVLP